MSDYAKMAVENLNSINGKSVPAASAYVAIGVALVQAVLDVAEALRERNRGAA